MQRVAPVLLALLATACSNPFGGGTSGRVAAEASRTRGSEPATGPEAGASPEAVTPPAAAAQAPAATQARPASTECRTALDARDAERTRIAALRLTLGVEEARRFDAATAAQQGCLADPECAQDGKRLVERFDAVKAAEDALGAAQRRLAEEELGLYRADQAVQAACGAE